MTSKDVRVFRYSPMEFWGFVALAIFMPCMFVVLPLVNEDGPDYQGAAIMGSIGFGFGLLLAWNAARIRRTLLKLTDAGFEYCHASGKVSSLGWNDVDKVMLESKSVNGGSAFPSAIRVFVHGGHQVKINGVRDLEDAYAAMLYRVDAKSHT